MPKAGQKQLKCESCDKIFFDAIRFKIHIRAHKEITKWNCSICFKSYFSKSQLEKHYGTLEHRLCSKEQRNLNKVF
jgi:hypothetical protein